MKIAFRFILPLALLLGIVAYAIVPLVDSFTLKWFKNDLDIRSSLIFNSIEEPLADLIKSNSQKKIMDYFQRLTQDERLYAIAFCDSTGKRIFETENFIHQFSCPKERLEIDPSTTVLNLVTGSLHLATHQIRSNGMTFGTLVIIHDMSFIERRSITTRKYIALFFLGLVLLVSTVTVLIAQLSWRRWLLGMRALLRNHDPLKPFGQNPVSELRPLANDLRSLIRDLESDRRARDESQLVWSPQTLRSILREELAGEELIAVSNREPYIHVRQQDRIEVRIPASGLVTALEPIMRACSGTWIAHGAGSADRETVDKKDHVAVPPDNPQYQIRRLWLTPEEEKGYYYGFSNEGLWPLCHIAHVRPVFRSSDWKSYVKINKRFAQAVVDEAKSEDPIVLVQDYHFALLPEMIREILPNATLITFWHIPWPNPEAFGICPWREELLKGLLGSSILGFHTRFHCNNFIDTVDRFLETRIDRENLTITCAGQTTAINQYPISIDWPPRTFKDLGTIEECRKNIRIANNLPPDQRVGIGVDRLDYTKGILERFMSIERMLELQPELVGKFTFIQIAAPSRSSIEQYQRFENDVRSLATRINSRFMQGNTAPICLKIEHYEPRDVFRYFRGADVCIVSSLHDGMNLVAKEFVAARDDEQGVLILSQFTGASRELTEALIVNPYNIDQCATALGMALSMPGKEQRDRMRSMRSLIKEFNVYRWAGKMLIDASRMRQQQRLLGRIQSSGL